MILKKYIMLIQGQKIGCNGQETHQTNKNESC